ncbi:hypothetical protein [Aquabacter sp. CN5-332]|uniref:hypothetical protein n=1 Tax=Aquabacter sp. CN5-332 TaxID=3156608 RepID=UPI0032B5FBBB
MRALACVALVSVTIAPAAAGTLLADLADRSLSCATNPPFYISRQSKTLSTQVFPDKPEGPPLDVTMTLVAPALVASNADRFEVQLPQVAGQAKPQRAVFKRTLEPPEAGAASRKPRTVISLHLDGDGVGGECVLARGRSEFVADRFNVIREVLCGNDPAPTCERLLEKRCGAEPTVDCAVTQRPDLDQATKTYFDRLNAKAGTNPSLGAR